jgi:hypothetical protein
MAGGISPEERLRAMKVLVGLQRAIPLIESLVEQTMGKDWLAEVNSRLDEPIESLLDERAGLALLEHTPELAKAIGSDWVQNVSDLNWIISKAVHNELGKWASEDAERAEQLGEGLIAHLSRLASRP